MNESEGLRMRRFKQVVCLAAVFMVGVMAAGFASTLPEPRPDSLPRWRGFNLLEKFIKGGSSGGPYRQEDFRLISEWGFNFVRLPMDYRFWIKDGDWTQIDETAFADIDQAIAFGRKYDIHVCINFHRAPGYTVAQPPEPADLWTDSQAQHVCAKHWAYFARRYKDVPNTHLSFNLLNEPADIDGRTYYRVVEKLVAAIRAEDPNRLIIADGLNWGKQPCEELFRLGVAQAARGYEPFALTHYKASWVAGSQSWPVPQWPAPVAGGGYLYGPTKPELRSPMRLNVNLHAPATLTLTVGTVSASAHLVVWQGDEELWSQTFTPGPGEGPWKEVVFRPEWNVYQNVYDRSYEVSLSAGRYLLTLDNVRGDWLTLTGLKLRTQDGTAVDFPIRPEWGRPNEPLRVESDANGCRFVAPRRQDAHWLWQTVFSRWHTARGQGIGVMVGEWGAHNRTPHEVTLRWMEDCLKTFQHAEIGWALWNFRGSFGILDSGRTDVPYEDLDGLKLDRKMLELLRRY